MALRPDTQAIRGPRAALEPHRVLTQPTLAFTPGIWPTGRQVTERRCRPCYPTWAETMPRRVPPGTRPQGSRRAAANRPTVMGRTLIVVLLAGPDRRGRLLDAPGLPYLGCRVAETTSVPAVHGPTGAHGPNPSAAAPLPSRPDRTHLLSLRFPSYDSHPQRRYLPPPLPAPNRAYVFRRARQRPRPDPRRPAPWVLLHDEELVRQFFEGGRMAGCPGGPGSCRWRSGRSLIRALTALLGLALLFHRPWTEGERLTIRWSSWPGKSPAKSLHHRRSRQPLPSLFANP